MVRSAQSPDQGLDAVARLLRDRVHRYSWVGFYLRNGDRLELGPNTDRDHPPHPATVALDDGPQGLAAASGATVLLPELRRDPRWLSCPATARSEIVVPVQENGTVYGEIDVDSKRPDGFGLDDRRFLEALAEELRPLFRGHG
ncbi:MAG: GAF domain-containing protein [Chloroflexota bacterium]